jgi:Tripartite tricarboxylate transporter family receptor
MKLPHRRQFLHLAAGAAGLPAVSRLAWAQAYPSRPVRTRPPRIVDRLNMEINAGLADPKMEARIGDLGATVLALSPADFDRLIAEETEKWAKVIRAANIKPE